MSPNEIIAMAREAGFRIGELQTLGGTRPLAKPSGFDCLAELEHFAAMVAAKERDACAQIADIHALGWQKSPGANPEAGFIASSNCATAIRARGKP